MGFFNRVIRIKKVKKTKEEKEKEKAEKEKEKENDKGTTKEKDESEGKKSKKKPKKENSEEGKKASLFCKVTTFMLIGYTYIYTLATLLNLPLYEGLKSSVKGR